MTPASGWQGSVGGGGGSVGGGSRPESPEFLGLGLFLDPKGLSRGLVTGPAEGPAEGLAKERVEKDKAMFGGQEVKGKTVGVIGLGHIGSTTAADCEALGMKVTGYDPMMTVKSALKLPKDTVLQDSMKAVFSQSDYVSLNIPYINKPPADGGTHAIIGRDLLMAAKSGAKPLPPVDEDDESLDDVI